MTLLAIHALWLAAMALFLATVMPAVAVACVLGLVWVSYGVILKVVG